jgi:hypothetical protein
MKPLQLWLPCLGRSLNFPEVSRDAQRAFELWQGEAVVWMLPEIRTPVRWSSRGIRNLGVPSEEIDKIDIVHVSEKGQIYAPGAEGHFPSTLDGLFDCWLNVWKLGGATFISPPEPFPMIVPHIDPGKGVSYHRRVLRFGPGAYLPFSSVDQKSAEVTMRWPPEGLPSPVSPEAESVARYPLTQTDSDPSLVMTGNGDHALHVWLRWPAPLDTIMPLLSSADDIHAQTQLSNIARLSSSDHAQSLRAAEIGAQRYLFSGHTTLEHSWLRPALAENGAPHVILKAEERGLFAPKSLRDQWNVTASNELLKELLKLDEWCERLAEVVSIRRVWGAAGLFWTLLLDRLQAGRPFISCETCGRIISGKAGKQFCGKSDDIQCFRSRRTTDKRRSRLAAR